MATHQAGTCGGCGTPLRTHNDANSTVRYCSNACRQRAYRLRLKETGLGDCSSASLQAQMNSFVGRVDEIIETARLLREGRLVTLTGAPGAGKTRLAGEVAAQEQRSGRYEVIPVELAALTDGPSVRQHVLDAAPAAAGRQGDPGPSRLVVLDTCEHMLDDCGVAVTSLLARSPQVRVLATSRERLRLPGEVVVPVRGLRAARAIDGDDVIAGAAEVGRQPAVQLFVDRARAVLPGFQLTDANAAEISELCLELDGLPLAIELAAELVRVFPVAEIRRRMDDRLELLAGGWRTAEPRHHSLRAAIDWSHRLLTEDERALLRTLSVLPGGFGSDIATAAAVGNGIAPARVAPLLVALEAKSMIVTASRQTAAVRFRMPTSVRLFGREQLVANGEHDRVQEVLADWLVESTGSFPYRGVLAPAAIGRLAAERQNLAAALDRLGAGADERQLFLAAAADVLDLLHDRVAAPGKLRTALAATGEGAEHRFVATATEAVIAAWRGDHDAARRSAQEVLTSRTASQRRRMSTLVTLLGQPSPEDLRDCLHTSVAGEDTALTALCLYTVAGRLLGQDGVTRGGRLLAEAMEVVQAGPMPGPAWMLRHATGALAVAAGDRQRAEECFATLLREAEQPRHEVLALQGLAITAVAAGGHDRGTQLLAAASALGGSGGFAGSPAWQARLSAAEARAAETLSAAQLAAARDHGHSLSRRQAVHYALRSRPDHSRTPPGAELSHREWEVAVLVAQGLTNRQIAARLYISVRTVETHVRSIRTTLGLNTRAHIAAWTTQRSNAGPGTDRTAPAGDQRRSGSAPIAG